MPILDILGIAMNALSCFLLTGFIGAFVIPEVIMWAFIILPQAIWAKSEKKMLSRGVWCVFRKILFWIVFTPVLYACAFLISPEIGWYLLTSIAAIICWALCVFVTVRALVTKRSDYLDAFYKGIYMEYMTDTEQERYQAFIESVEQMSISEAQDKIKNDQLGYLERTALSERINLLQKNPLQELRMIPDSGDKSQA